MPFFRFPILLSCMVVGLTLTNNQNLGGEIRETTGIATRKALMDYAMAMHSENAVPPNLGAAVTQAAEAGDAYAQEILMRAGEWAFQLADELAQALHMDEEPSFSVGIWGSVLMNSAPMCDSFRQKLQKQYPQAVFIRPDRDAAQGAVELALRWHQHGGSCAELLRTSEH